MGEVGGAVQRIDDPAVIPLCAVNLRFLFGEDRMLGKIAPEHRYDFTFAFLVHRGDQVDGAFTIDSFWLQPACPEDFTRPVGRIPCRAEQSYDVVGYPQCSFAIPSPLC